MSVHCEYFIDASIVVFYKVFQCFVRGGDTSVI